MSNNNQTNPKSNYNTGDTTLTLPQERIMKREKQLQVSKQQGVPSHSIKSTKKNNANSEAWDLINLSKQRLAHSSKGPFTISDTDDDSSCNSTPDDDYDNENEELEDDDLSFRSEIEISFGDTFDNKDLSFDSKEHYNTNSSFKEEDDIIHTVKQFKNPTSVEGTDQTRDDPLSLNVILGGNSATAIRTNQVRQPRFKVGNRMRMFVTKSRNIMKQWKLAA